MEKPELIQSVKVCGNCQYFVEREIDEQHEPYRNWTECCLSHKELEPSHVGCEKHSMVSYLDPEWYGLKLGREGN